MLHTSTIVVVAMATCFEDVVKSDYITLDISIGVGYRVSHTCLGSKIDNDFKIVVGKKGGLECCGSWGCKELDMTERLN